MKTRKIIAIFSGGKTTRVSVEWVGRVCGGYVCVCVCVCACECVRVCVCVGVISFIAGVISS